LTALQVTLLIAAGLAAGTVNGLAGGGTFFTFAALVASGLPTLDANATSAVALTPANLASVVAYRSEVSAYRKEMVALAALGAAGAAVGAWLLIAIGDAGFRPTVPWLLLLATLLFAFSGSIRAVVWPSGGQRISTVVVSALMFLISIYGGFFGAGMGIVMLAGLSIIHPGDFHRANAIKNFVALLVQIVSATLLIAGGLVHWQQAIITTVASIVGGYAGVGLARRASAKLIRAVVVTVGAALTVVFFLR
jgi:uncharacterized protein